MVVNAIGWTLIFIAVVLVFGIIWKHSNNETELAEKAERQRDAVKDILTKYVFYAYDLNREEGLNDQWYDLYLKAEKLLREMHEEELEDVGEALI